MRSFYQNCGKRATAFKQVGELPPARRRYKRLTYVFSWTMVENMKTFEYRLYVKKEQSHLLMACLAESRHIYNSMLEMVKQQYEEKGTFPSKYDLEHAFKGQGSTPIPATTVQMLADRLSKSLKRFLAAKANDLPGIGFHRFKKPNR